MIMMFKTKKDVDHILEKAHRVKEEAIEMVECLEDAIEEMEEKYGREENYRHEDYDRDREYRKSRFEYRRR